MSADEKSALALRAGHIHGRDWYVPPDQQYETATAVDYVWIVFCQLRCSTPPLGPFHRDGHRLPLSVANAAAHRAGWVDVYTRDAKGHPTDVLGWVCPSCQRAIARAKRDLPGAVGAHARDDAARATCAVEGHVASEYRAGHCGRCYAPLAEPAPPERA